MNIDITNTERKILITAAQLNLEYWLYEANACEYYREILGALIILDKLWPSKVYYIQDFHKILKEHNFKVGLDDFYKVFPDYIQCVEVQTMAKLEDYENKDFFIIEKGEIEFYGYFYYEDRWVHYDYSGSFRLTVKDFIEKYHRNYSKAYEDIAAPRTHYMLAEDDDEYALQEIQSTLNSWVKGAVPLDLDSITEDTPDGYYVTTGIPVIE